jgi:hypothetical protein
MARPVAEIPQSTEGEGSGFEPIQSATGPQRAKTWGVFISHTRVSELVEAPRTIFQNVFSPTEKSTTDQNEDMRTDRSHPEKVSAEPVRLPVQLKALPPRSTFFAIEEWEGTVLSASDDSFTARLVNRTRAQAADEEGRFAMAQLSSQEDRNLLVPGAIFYFSVGYEESPSGQRRTSAFLRFRRLPAWTARELADVEAEADRLAALFGVSEEGRPGEASSG